MEHYELIRRKVVIKGKSQRDVAKELGHSRETIAKALKPRIPPGYRLSKPRPRPVIEPVKHIIDSWLEQNKKAHRKQNQSRILRICWETNGSMNPKLLDKMMDFSLKSGGCIKFDLKAMDTNIHYALCGVRNKQTLQNFTRAAQRIAERPQPPPLIASTLLVPGYIDAREIDKIASFIAIINPDIPYALLGFHGDFLMTNLPRTSWDQANRCLKAARDSGLKRVRIGNTHILS